MISHARPLTARFTCGTLFVLALCACAPLPPERGTSPQGTTLPVERRASPNFDGRKPNFVIIHHTTDSTADEALAVLTDPARKVSAHYLIARDGRLVQLVAETQRAWHAGDSYWGGQRDLNSASIGIELDNDGHEPFAAAQIEMLLALLSDLKTRYNIPAANFLGHADVAPGRKVDPSASFPWRLLAQHGFGLWCDPPFAAAPAELPSELMLQAFGYKVWNPDAATASFKLHFAPDDPSPLLNEKDRAMLYCLLAEQRGLAAQ